MYNPTNMPLDRVRRAVQKQERRHGWRPSLWLPTDRADSGRGATESAREAGADVVAIAGGDGTVRIASEVLAGSGIPVALLPLGTGNLLARNLRIPLNDLERAVGVVFSGEERAVDVCRAEVEYPSGERAGFAFVVMAGIGLDASMAKETTASAKRRLGWGAYVFPIARSILANRKISFHYRVDGERTRSARAHTVIVGNCGTLTGNMLLLPAAEVDDGLIDVVMLRPRGRFEWARIGTRLTVQRVARRSQLGREALAKTDELKALAYAQGREFEVRFETPHEAQLDGDSIGKIVAARITVDPGAMRILVPK